MSARLRPGPRSRGPRALSGAALACALLAACSRTPEAPRPDPTAAGFWFTARERPDVDLGALGYAAGTRPESPSLAAPIGGRVHLPEATAPGLNLWCAGHAPEAYLETLAGEPVHRWAVDPDRLPGVPPLRHATQRAWRRVRLLPDGGLLALHEAHALLRLDVDSALVWAVGEGAHHDFDLDAAGRVHVLVRRAVEHPGIAGGQTVVDDGVLVLGPDGAVVARHSLLEALARSPWAHVLDAAAAQPDGRTLDAGDGLARDLLHVNAYALLRSVPAGLPAAFQPGRALLCFRELDALALFDPEAGALVWYSAGALDGPHDPELGADGRLWVFDNGLRRGWSRAVALDPSTGREVAAWPAAPDPAFHSEVCGALQLLPHGGLLLTESTAGRAFEVTAEGALAWSYATPHRVERRSPDGPSERFVACLFEVERIAPEDLPARFRSALR